MRYVFVFILLAHGAIHLMGFAKAFRYAELPDLSLPVSRPMGVVWLLCTLLFLATAVFFLTGMKTWWIAGIPAVLLSQLVIFLYWRDARFGTLANVIVLVGIVLAWGRWQFQTTMQDDLRHFLTLQEPVPEQLLHADMLVGLPPIVQTWLHRSNSIGKPLIRAVGLKQTGRMRTAPDGRWMSFDAWQHISVREPGFFWIVNAKVAPYIHIAGRDKYESGKGYMLIKLQSLIPVADASGPEMDQGAMLRFLAEMIWYPSAALSDYVRWEPVDSLSARATMRYGDVEASGLFSFTPAGDPVSFEAMRYYNRKSGATLEKWVIRMGPDGFKDFNDIRIPARSTVSWELEDGTFDWLELQIVDLEHHDKAPER